MLNHNNPFDPNNAYGVQSDPMGHKIHDFAREEVRQSMQKKKENQEREMYGEPKSKFSVMFAVFCLLKLKEWSDKSVRKDKKDKKEAKSSSKGFNYAAIGGGVIAAAAIGLLASSIQNELGSKEVDVSNRLIHDVDRKSSAQRLSLK